MELRASPLDVEPGEKRAFARVAVLKVPLPAVILGLIVWV